ncbi:MAG TPA: hypothetical protein HPP76_02270 [Desulfuromonadales bacterium]|nr:hypothetical protein [Desulfuromonadales bacterium]
MRTVNLPIPSFSAPLKNRNGIALITALMLTLISMAIIMSLLYVMTASTQRSGAMKRYRTALEASYGGTELVAKEVMPYIMNQFQQYTSSQVINNLRNDYSTVSMASTTANCLKSKFTLPTASWAASCGSSLDPKTNPDLQMTLQASGNGQPFVVYSKIVDTTVGNSDTSGSRLDAAEGAAGIGSGIEPQHYPYLYRLEVQGERQTNAVEKSNISVLYAY